MPEAEVIARGVGIEVRLIPGKGRGVFATEPVPASAVIEVCPTIGLTQYDRDLIFKTRLSDYAFGDSDYINVWGSLVLGFGMLYNHANEPNAKVDAELAKGTYVYRALKPIRVGEEITISYASGFDENQWNPFIETPHDRKDASEMHEATANKTETKPLKEPTVGTRVVRQWYSRAISEQVHVLGEVVSSSNGFVVVKEYIDNSKSGERLEVRNLWSFHNEYKTFDEMSENDLRSYATSLAASLLTRTAALTKEFTNVVCCHPDVRSKIPEHLIQAMSLLQNFSEMGYDKMRLEFGAEPRTDEVKRPNEPRAHVEVSVGSDEKSPEVKPA